MVVALAASAACGSEAGGAPKDGPTETVEATGAADESSAASDSGETIGSLFPGKGAGGQSAPIDVPTAKVGESAGGEVKVASASDRPMNLAIPRALVDDPAMGEATVGLGSCTGTLDPGEECELDFRFVPYKAGSYSGVLTVETSQGETITVPFSGEAVGDEPSPTTETPEPSPTTETPEQPEPTTETPEQPEPTTEPTPIETEPQPEPESEVT
ncbi:hypothetical protein DEJ46_25605 [Streptomyces venezuelae]|uniref:Uncharacterized protein n=1 Tax=Streptomyces venezuelae TaxID=54571 RepID=A0A5P2AUW6_STRVZ|nr:hypothetical protein DEJ46_25605 [Streptomyces venezuelae]